MSQASTLSLPDVHRHAGAQWQARAHWPGSKQVPPAPGPRGMQIHMLCLAGKQFFRACQRSAPQALASVSRHLGHHDAQVVSETQAVLAGKGGSNKASPLRGQLSGNLSDGLPNGEDCRRQQQHVTQQPGQLDRTALEHRPSAKQQHPQQQLQVICMAVVGPRAMPQQQEGPSQDAGVPAASWWWPWLGSLLTRCRKGRSAAGPATHRHQPPSPYTALGALMADLIRCTTAAGEVLLSPTTVSTHSSRGTPGESHLVPNCCRGGPAQPNAIRAAAACPQPSALTASSRPSWQ